MRIAATTEFLDAVRDAGLIFRNGQVFYTDGDPRRKAYGTPRKETLVRLAHGAPEGGCFVEFGVALGDSAIPLYRLAQEQGRKLHLFDTFAGMPICGVHDDIPVGAHAGADLPMLRRMMPEAEFYVGVFPDTMPKNLANIAFAHIDCNQYESYIAAITEFLPRLMPGGVMLFDDYNVCPGAEKAINEKIGKDKLIRTREGKAYYRQ